MTQTPEITADAVGPSDAELITAVRSGDQEAFGELFARHQAAARGLARQLVRDPNEADDLVSESFAKILQVLRGGGGPDAAFRAYLYTTVRRVAYDRTKAVNRVRPTDDLTPYDAGVPFVDPALEGLEKTLVASAFRTLPERWQAVLWHTEVEGLPPAQVGVLLGLTANGVSALAYRAREGLRQAYLQQHLAGEVPDGCAAIHDKLGAYARGGLSRRETAQVDEHLEGCPKCRALVLELTDVSHGMRVVIAPLILGTAGIAALKAGLLGTGMAAVGSHRHQRYARRVGAGPLARPGPARPCPARACPPSRPASSPCSSSASPALPSPADCSPATTRPTWTPSPGRRTSLPGKPAVRPPATWRPARAAADLTSSPPPAAPAAAAARATDPGTGPGTAATATDPGTGRATGRGHGTATGNGVGTGAGWHGQGRGGCVRRARPPTRRPPRRARTRRPRRARRAARRLPQRPRARPRRTRPSPSTSPSSSPSDSPSPTTSPSSSTPSTLSAQLEPLGDLVAGQDGILGFTVSAQGDAGASGVTANIELPPGVELTGTAVRSGQGFGLGAVLAEPFVVSGDWICLGTTGTITCTGPNVAPGGTDQRLSAGPCGGRRRRHHAGIGDRLRDGPHPGHGHRHRGGRRQGRERAVRRVGSPGRHGGRRAPAVLPDR